MRLFWTIIALLFVSTAAWWLLRAPAPTPPTMPDPITVLQQQPRPAKPVAAAPGPTPSVAPPTPKPSVAETPRAAPAPGVAATKPVAEPDAPAALPKVEPAKPAAAAAPATANVHTPAKVPNPEAPVDFPSEIAGMIDGAAATPAGDSTKKPEVVKPTDGAKPEAPAAVKVKLTPQEDGSTLVDDKYIIKGTGTKDDPYRVTWEMVISAQDTYQPRLGRKVIPDRLKMIDGKWVRIQGYIAFPIMSASPDEMLMMLNQWDGCCIGVPPTPYDAIEVKLKTAAKGNDRLRTSGTLTGRFKVDPYLVKDWLVSLYIMDEAVLSDTAGAADATQHAK